MTRDKAREQPIKRRQTVLAEVNKDYGQVAVYGLIRELNLEEIFSFEEGTYF